MLEFTFVQNYYVQDPLYAITRYGLSIGTIEYDGSNWVVQSVGYCRSLTSNDFIQIGNKLAEINASLRAQRWFK